MAMPLPELLISIGVPDTPASPVTKNCKVGVVTVNVSSAGEPYQCRR
jgi:hypothetical protein